MNKKTKELADLISFRLLATNKHSDYGYVINLKRNQEHSSQS